MNKLLCSKKNSPSVNWYNSCLLQIKYYVLISFHIIYLYFSAPWSVPLINLIATVKIINKVTTIICIQSTFWPATNKTVCLFACTGDRSNQTVIKLTFSFPWKLSFGPTATFLSLRWKSKNLNFGQPSLSLTHCGMVQECMRVCSMAKRYWHGGIRWIRIKTRN